MYRLTLVAGGTCNKFEVLQNDIFNVGKIQVKNLVPIEERRDIELTETELKYADFPATTSKYTLFSNQDGNKPFQLAFQKGDINLLLRHYIHTVQIKFTI